MSRILLHAAVPLILTPPIIFALRETYDAYLSPTSSHSRGRLAILALAILLYTLRISLQNLNYALRARASGCLPAPRFPVLDPLLGLDLFLDSLRAIKRSRLLVRYAERFDRIGARTYWSLTLGQWVLMTDEPENIKAILGGPSGHEDYAIAGPRLYSVLPALGDKSIFTTNGPAWAHSRALVRPSFVRDQVADLKCFGRHVGNLVEKMREENGVFDLQALLMDMTMDSSTDFLLGYSTNMLKNPTAEVRSFVQAFERASQIGGQRALLGSLAFLFPNAKLDAAVAEIKSFVGRYMDRASAAISSPESRHDAAFQEKQKYLFLCELLKSEAPREYILDQVMSIILAGRDTTAASLASVFFYLAKNPTAMEKCRKEIEELRAVEPSWEQLKNMRHLNNCIREALRLLPPIGTNSRQATKELVLPRGGGKDGKSPVLVPKGTQCRFTSYSMHRRKDIYGEDAEEFRPERWEDLRTTWEYIPFSAGARICLGQQFAMTQMAFTVFRVLQNFKTIESMDDGPFELRVSLTAALARGCLVRVTPA